MAKPSLSATRRGRFRSGHYSQPNIRHFDLAKRTAETPGKKNPCRITAARVKEWREIELELEPDTKLKGARIANAGDLSETRRGHVGAKSSEVRVVQYVERLAPKLYLVRLSKVEILGERKIDSLRRWTQDNTSWRISHCVAEPGSSNRGVRLEACGVEPL